MPEFLEVAIDKFTFRVASDRLYTEEGVWAKLEAGSVRVGLSDFLQQRSGDIAFVDVKPVGARVNAGEEIATIETVKVNVGLGSPVAGRVTETNPVLRSAPETINADPYGGGWLAIIEASDWPADQRRLLTPGAYLNAVKRLAGEEASGA
jgi:glycine cleavage system H protein